MSSQVFTMPRRGLRSRQVATLEKLLLAGQEELRAVGHEQLTIRTVAARAGVSPATAYTYLASKNHLFAEIFWGYLTEDSAAAPAGADATARVQDVCRRLVRRLAEEPELAAAVTPALLASDPDVAPLRVRIGQIFLDAFRVALATDGAHDEQGGDEGDVDVLDALLLAFSGALLQAGMGLMTYTEMGARLDVVVATILRGNR